MFTKNPGTVLFTHTASLVELSNGIVDLGLLLYVFFFFAFLAVLERPYWNNVLMDSCFCVFLGSNFKLTGQCLFSLSKVCFRIC